MAPTFSIRAVVEETGLSAHTIRAWERRYGVPSPARTGSNRRMYGEEDVRRLKLLHRAVAAGHSIGMIASLTAEDLVRLTRAEDRREEGPAMGNGTAQGVVRAATQALGALDATGFEAALARGTVVLGIDALVDEIVVPILTRIGREWEAGEISIAEEHLASAVIRTHLERTRLSINASPGAPRLVATTLPGQQHELGTMLAAVVAARLDWDVTYLGPNLPAKEIADSAKRLQASAVALSFVYPIGDPALGPELRLLRLLLGADVEIIAGGAAASSYAQVLEEVGSRVCHDLGNLREALARARRPFVAFQAP